MSDFENLFDTAITQADNTILQVMGNPATVTSGAISGVVLSGVFDDPENIVYASPGVRIEGTSPSLFVKTATIGQLSRLDTLDINGKPFWVDRIGPDDCGSCYIWLGTGSPPAAGRRR